MTETARVKVRCGQCGTVLCTVVDDGEETFYRLRQGTSMDANTVFCADHGWPDLAAESLAADLAQARRSGRLVTHRSRVSRAPIADRASYTGLARTRLTR